MRAVVALTAAAALALLLMRKSESAVGRGDEPDLFYDYSLDPNDYLAPIDFLDYWEIMPREPDPIYDPRDVTARTFSASSMAPSEQLASWLRAKENFSAKKYDLGDGGVTIGYGWFEPHSRAHLMPDTITEAKAREVFYRQLEERGARWVREYVRVPLTQNEFDALTSMAYNLSPGSFMRIATALNNGEDWREVALQFVRPDKPKLTQGLINRRTAEIAMFDQGVYA
jgi:lysozyme